MIWLRIESEPPRQFVKNPGDLASLTVAEAKHVLLESVGKLVSGVDGETPNITLSLRNANAECARIFLSPPLGAAAALMDADGVVFSGIVSRVSLDETCQVTIQA